MTYRLAPHGAADPEKYRSKEEVASWRDRDPLALLERRLRDGGEVDDAAVEEIAGGARDEVAAALEFWADTRAGRLVKPPPMGSDGYPALGEAPGDYVRGWPRSGLAPRGVRPCVSRGLAVQGDA